MYCKMEDYKHDPKETKDGEKRYVTEVVADFIGDSLSNKDDEPSNFETFGDDEQILKGSAETLPDKRNKHKQTYDVMRGEKQKGCDAVVGKTGNEYKKQKHVSTPFN